MPPLRSDRASRACNTCRKLKTRCYPSKQKTGSCLRCETQNQACSLTSLLRHDVYTRDRDHDLEMQSPSAVTGVSTIGVEARLAKLEGMVHTLVDRLDIMTRQTSAFSESREPTSTRAESVPSVSERDAPVMMIKGIAENMSSNHQGNADTLDDDPDPITNGLIGMNEAYELLTLFRLHYGRWVNFDEQISIEQLMTLIRGSPLLFYSICLVAARHTLQRHVNELAPLFFREAKCLLQASLLTTPQPLEFFQSALILSLWSTTIGQVPLSIDSWLLTSYTLQQGWASSMAMSVKGLPADDKRLRACCTWNHICLSHLQYCVGTGRKTLLQEAQIDRCAEVMEFDIPQFEVRMVAELRLYWIMVTRCCASTVDLANIRNVLHAWRIEWSFLFQQPRSQFLEMGYNFAILLAQCRSLHSQPSKLSRSRLNEMVQRARDIIELAKAHTDERTPHLTDHIYHVITFSAITLCQLITKYSNVLVSPNTSATLTEDVPSLVNWLRSIGLRSHVSRVLADIIATHYKKCTTQEHFDPMQTTERNTSTNYTTAQTSHLDTTAATALQGTPDGTAMDSIFQDLAWTTFFDFNADTAPWPQSNELLINSYTPTDESWTTSAHATSP